MNTNDAELLHLFEALTTEQKIDIARTLIDQIHHRYFHRRR